MTSYDWCYAGNDPNAGSYQRGGCIISLRYVDLTCQSDFTFTKTDGRSLEKIDRWMLWHIDAIYYVLLFMATQSKNRGSWQGPHCVVIVSMLSYCIVNSGIASYPWTQYKQSTWPLLSSPKHAVCILMHQLPFTDG